MICIAILYTMIPHMAVEQLPPPKLLHCGFRTAEECYAKHTEYATAITVAVIDDHMDRMETGRFANPHTGCVWIEEELT